MPKANELKQGSAVEYSGKMLAAGQYNGEHKTAIVCSEDTDSKHQINITYVLIEHVHMYRYLLATPLGYSYLK